VSRQDCDALALQAVGKTASAEQLHRLRLSVSLPTIVCLAVLLIKSLVAPITAETILYREVDVVVIDIRHLVAQTAHV
jgi:hypothetical protein